MAHGPVAQWFGVSGAVKIFGFGSGFERLLFRPRSFARERSDAGECWELGLHGCLCLGRWSFSLRKAIHSVVKLW